MIRFLILIASLPIFSLAATEHDGEGLTPLHIAAGAGNDAVSGGHFEAAKVLIESCADATIKGHDGKTVTATQILGSISRDSCE